MNTKHKQNKKSVICGHSCGHTMWQAQREESLSQGTVEEEEEEDKRSMTIYLWKHGYPENPGCKQLSLIFIYYNELHMYVCELFIHCLDHMLDS